MWHIAACDAIACGGTIFLRYMSIMDWPKDNADIISLILTHEGGLVDNPDDRGGITRYGVTIDTLASFRKSPVTADDIKALTVQEASALYLAKYIVGPNFDQVLSINLRTALVDFGVLFGPIRAIQALQGIIGYPQDGVLGPKSLAAVNSWPDKRALVNELSAARISRHVDRVTVDPTQLQFLKGWIFRAISFIE